jgi:hypothetical protein
MDYEVRIKIIRKDGRVGVVDLYKADNWDEGYGLRRFRVKVNGRWVGGREKVFFSKSKIREMLWKELNWLKGV